MSEINRRQFGVLALLGGIGALSRLSRRFGDDLPPTQADAAVAEGALIWVTLPGGRNIRRVCRSGYWVTAGPVG